VKKIMLALFMLNLVLASCVCRQSSIPFSPTSTDRPRPSSTFAVRPVPTETPYIPNLTPEITATPFVFKSHSQDITQIIGEIYGIPTACNHSDFSNQEKPEFTDITRQVRIDQLYIDEIADSEHKTYRAYLVEEPVREVCNACFRTRVYSMKLSTGEMYMISWSRYLPARILLRLIWIGDRVLAFEQSLSPHEGEIVAVDVEEQSFVYDGYVSDFCK
jgi:hypothetical protein